VIVHLSERDLKIVAAIARGRKKANREIGRYDNKTKGFDGQDVDELGVAGEMAFTRETGIPWTNKLVSSSKLLEWGSRPQPDCGTDIEVRTRSKSWHQLLVHKNDPVEWRFILVRRVDGVGPGEDYDLVGWGHGEAVKQEKYWLPYLPYEAYGYPNELLRPIEELEELNPTL